MDLKKANNITQIQQKASDISQSVWVSASAGSGKTSVLTKRLIRLLLNNIKPSKILCLTFTKNASAEMRNRINKELSEWTLLSNEKLKDKINKLIGHQPTEKILQNARTLFAKILDNADELKILTIHSFCQQIMKKFPFEAGIIPNFKIADERLEEEFLIEAKKELLVGKILEPKIKKAIERIAIQINQKDFKELISELLGKRDKLIYLKNICRGEDEIIRQVYKTLNVNLEDNEEDLFDKFLNYKIDKREFEKIYTTVQEFGTKTEKPKFEILKTWINQPKQRRLNFEEYKSFFLYKSKSKERNIDDKKTKLITSKPKTQYPQALEILEIEQERVYQFVQKLKSIRIAELTKSMLIIGYEILEKYKIIKAQKGILDYSDLIIKTKDLLTNSDNSYWISYKLDEGIDHILVDEAQDTSPYQWTIIKALVDEFFTSEKHKTIFVVGDEKQSIFSFQGADPKMFTAMNRFYERECNQNQKPFSTIPFDSSFRSLSSILELVDKIFEPKEFRQSISLLEPEKIRHNPVRFGTGKVELWPLIKIEEDAESEDFQWSMPFQNKIKISNIEKLAITIAEKVKNWIAKGKIILDRKTGQKRLLKYSDIMILLKSRNRFADTIIKTLNKFDIPVAGIDRLKLTENLVIKDLIALANFILFPEDNLNLANIIKSPIMGLNENDLFELCRGTLLQENKISLWQSIQQNSKYSKTKDYLNEVIELNKVLTPYELFFHILDIKDGRKKIINRFSETANDLLNEFLNLLKNFEQNHNTSLNDFMSYLKVSPVTIKRDMEQVSNEVRIMTVHGSKGLQAPIIFMPDTYHSTKTLQGKNKIFWVNDTKLEECENDFEIPFWNGESKNDNEFILKLKTLGKKEIFDEYLRLLYVALTRSENELYICGWEIKKPYKDNWYDLILQSMKSLGKPKKFDFDEEDFGYIFGDIDEFDLSLKEEKIEVKISNEKQKKIGNVLQNLTLYRNEKELTKIINPSEFYNHQDRDSSPTQTSESMVQGEAVHKLLEILPQTGAEERGKIADYYLNSLFKKFTPKVKEKIKNNVFKILEEFQDLFTKDSKAEVPIAGHVDDKIVSGQIDRLIVQDDRVIIIDYKNSYRNFEENEIPEAYKKQLELYKELISQVYTDKAIECYILWTGFCRLSRIWV